MAVTAGDHERGSLRYFRLYNDSSGNSCLGEGELALAPAAFAPPAPPVDVSDALDAAGFLMIRMPKGWTDQAHPAPARQFMILVSGKVEVIAGGDTRVFEAGDVVLVEDTSGPGHATTALEETVFAVVQLA